MGEDTRGNRNKNQGDRYTWSMKTVQGCFKFYSKPQSFKHNNGIKGIFKHTGTQGVCSHKLL